MTGFDQFLPNFRPCLAHLGRFPAEVGQHLVQIDRTRAKLGKFGEQFRRAPAHFGLNRPNLGPNSAKLGRIWAEPLQFQYRPNAVPSQSQRRIALHQDCGRFGPESSTSWRFRPELPDCLKSPSSPNGLSQNGYGLNRPQNAVQFQDSTNPAQHQHTNQPSMQHQHNANSRPSTHSRASPELPPHRRPERLRQRGHLRGARVALLARRRPRPVDGLALRPRRLRHGLAPQERGAEAVVHAAHGDVRGGAVHLLLALAVVGEGLPLPGGGQLSG